MRFRLPNTSVYWASTGANYQGSPVWAAPVQYSCRWEDVSENVIGKDGNMTKSRATVYLDGNVSPVDLNGVMMKGTLADVQASSFPPNIKSDPRTHEIIYVETDPSLDGRQSLTRVFLK